MADDRKYVYLLELDDSQLTEKLAQMDTALKQTAESAGNLFETVQNRAQTAGAAVEGGVGQQFQQMGQQAQVAVTGVDAFEKSLIKLTEANLKQLTAGDEVTQQFLKQQAAASGSMETFEEAFQAYAASFAEADPHVQRWLETSFEAAKAAAEQEQAIRVLTEAIGLERQAIEQSQASAANHEQAIERLSNQYHESDEAIEKAADAIFKHEQALTQDNAAMEQSKANIEAAKTQMAALGQTLNEKVAAQEKAAAVAQQHSERMKEVQAAAQATIQAEQRRQQELVKLTAAELQAAAGTDLQAKALVQATAAGSQNVQVFNQQIAASGLFTDAQQKQAQATARARQEIQRINEELAKGNITLEQAQRQTQQWTNQLQPFERQVGLTGSQMRQLGFAAQRMGIHGVAAFGEMAAAIGPVGIAIAAVVIPVIALTKAFIDLGKTAVSTFRDIVQESIEVGREFQLARRQFVAVFEGMEEVGEAAFQRIRAFSREMGADMTQLARVFLPEVESMDQLERILEIGTALAMFQPHQGAQGARIALENALEGAGAISLRSLRRRFELSPRAVQSIIELQDELGIVEGLIQGLGAELERKGRDFAQVAGTLEHNTGRISEAWTDLLSVMGLPITDELTEQTARIAEILSEDTEQFKVIFNAIGESIAGIVGALGDNLIPLLEGLDDERALELADAIRDIGLSVELLINTIANFDSEWTWIDLVVRGLNHIEMGLLGLTVMVAEFQIAMVPIQKHLENFVTSSRVMQAAIAGNWDEVKSLTGEMNTLADITQAVGLKQTEAAISILKYTMGTEQAARANRDFADSLKESSEWADAMQDALLGYNRAMENLFDTVMQFDSARLEIEDRLLGVDEKLAEDRAKVIEDSNRRIAEMEISLSEKREDIIRKGQQRIEDIYRKNAERIEDSGIRLSRDLQDIALDNAKKMEEIEKKSTDKKIDIEKKYRERIEDIRRNADRDAEEAIRQNDAIALLRIRRREQHQLEDARINRDRQSQDEENALQDSLAKQQQANEDRIEDAKKADRRRLEDLQRNLQRELDARKIAQQREFEEAQIAHERRRAQEQRNLDQRLNDLEKAAEAEREKILAELAELEKQVADAWERVAQATADKMKLLFQGAAAEMKEFARQAAEDILALQAILQRGGSGVIPGIGGIPGLTPPRTPGGPPLTPTGDPILPNDPNYPAGPPPQTRTYAGSPPLMGAGGIDNSTTVNADISVGNVGDASPVEQRKILQVVNNWWENINV
jgi:hypothetical protein